VKPAKFRAVFRFMGLTTKRRASVIYPFHRSEYLYLLAVRGYTTIINQALFVSWSIVHKGAAVGIRWTKRTPAVGIDIQP
jgi:hypothetical protein